MKKGIKMKFFLFSARIFAFTIMIILYIGCDGLEGNQNKSIFPKSENFGDYWYQGKAELNRYDLEQVRYGEIHKGDAVLIFVTEDFLKNEQVKYEYGDKTANVQTVLKLNSNRRFFTGIYPYSLLTCTFTPIRSNDSHSLKITFTAQEWCGHSFMQLNNWKNKYTVQQNSYFQAEGDKNFNIEHALLEDEVWTMIRINPDLLPIGEIDVIPAMQYVRLFHKNYKIEKTTVKKTEASEIALSANPLIKYTIGYHDLPRSLTIIFEKDFPYQILAWEETYGSNERTDNGDLLITKAVRTNKLMLDYWNKNSVADSVYRHELGLRQ
jgi:hypothetical protein